MLMGGVGHEEGGAMAKREEKPIPATEKTPARPRRTSGTIAPVASPPPAITPACDVARAVGDDAAMIAFIARRLERCDGSTMKAGDLFQLWGEDCAELGIDAGSQKSFSVRVRKFFQTDP